jgi:hypothetical protein
MDVKRVTLIIFVIFFLLENATVFSRAGHICANLLSLVSNSSISSLYASRMFYLSTDKHAGKGNIRENFKLHKGKHILD